MSTLPRLVRLCVIAVVAAACTTAIPSASSSRATPSVPPVASPTATQSGLAHPTGADEIVLRFDEAGGFVPIEFIAAHVPLFTLYGDGTVVFVKSGSGAGQGPDGVVTGAPLRTARLTEDQIQALLEIALDQGGLAVARAAYENPLVADAPTAVFEVHAGGAAKTVSVVALGMEGEPGPDSAIKAALARLGDRLRDFDQGGAFASAAYTPVAYRAVLLESGGAGGVAPRPWPWPTIPLADFVFPADPNAMRQGQRVMTPNEVAALAVNGAENGIQSGVFVTAPDGKVYSLVVRPLLPDEKS
jgi:hypothetical protein